MLQSKQRTPEEIDAYLEELKTWLKEDRDTPAEEMTDFFPNAWESMRTCTWVTGRRNTPISRIFSGMG